MKDHLYTNNINTMIEQLSLKKEQCAAVETARVLDRCSELVAQDEYAFNEGIRDEFLKDLRVALFQQTNTSQDHLPPIINK